MVNAVIFDMDGVLVDSNRYVWQSFEEVLKPYNIKFTKEEIRAQLGNSLKDIIAGWNKKYNLNLVDVDKFSREAGEIQFKLMKNEKPDLFLIKFLESLKKHNIPMGVGTSSKKWRAEKMLKVLKIEKYFSALVTADDVTEHKPNPHVFLEVAKRLSINPIDCVVIEDAESGIEAAKRGNMKAIGFLREQNTRDEFKKADRIISSFSEIGYEDIRKL